MHGILRSQIGPAQRKLTLAAFLVEEADPLFAAVFFVCQSFELMAREGMEGMRDPKLLGLHSTNGCSLMPLPRPQSIPKTQSAPRAEAGPKLASPCPQPVWGLPVRKSGQGRVRDRQDKVRFLSDARASPPPMLGLMTNSRTATFERST